MPSATNSSGDQPSSNSSSDQPSSNSSSDQPTSNSSDDQPTSNQSIREAMKQFMGKFRLQDNSLMSFTPAKREHILQFQEFVRQKANGTCSVCLRVLYPEERRYRPIQNIQSLNCFAWNITPLTRIARNGATEYMVCLDHYKGKEESKFPKYVYPGDVLEETKGLNYRERCAISPIKLMTQITRKSRKTNGVIGHYELSGPIGIRHNFEFAEMAYGATLGLYYRRGDPRTINKKKVTDAYEALKQVHPLLRRYDLPPLVHSLVNYHIKESSSHIGVKGNGKIEWPDNCFFAENTVNPEASEPGFEDLIIGKNGSSGSYIRLSTESLLALMFPHLYPHCKGHYSMSTPNGDNTSKDENHGGIAKATLYGETLKGYTRQRLYMADRRFARDQAFIFFLLDCVEKNNIASANRHVVSTKGRGNLTQRDIINPATKKFNKNIVSNVPYIVRSSFAYKRKNFLNLSTVFRNLGSPQLFLTFSCDDYSSDFAAATGTTKPWEDPVLFSAHFKRKWLCFFEKHLLGYFATEIGGIKDYSWVLEIQDRGSPHIHCVLWTNKTVEELIALNVVCCKLYPGTFNSDPLMHRLVLKHQIHRCQQVYCKLHLTGKCRFGYPKEPAPRTEFVGDECVYERGVEDMQVNAYNPYLLAVWRANMDIQYNKGEAAVRYLAKYMAKNESDAIFEIVNKGTSGNYKIRNEKSDKEHFKNRIVGAVEAVYDIMGWQKHHTSRAVAFVQTNLPGDDRRLIKPNIKDIRPNSKKIFSRTHVEKYEQRKGGANLTITQFYCFYREHSSSSSRNNRSNGGLQERDFYPEPLPLYIHSKKTKYALRKKQAFWRTFPQSKVNGEKYYYQQIVLNKAIFGTTFVLAKGRFPSWRDYFEHLVSLGPENGGLSIERSYNINNLPDVNDFERGPEATRSELDVMYANANDSQKSIFDRVKIELIVNSVTFVSGAAGTGKSYLLKMFERHYKLEGYKIFKLAPTGVAAFNISGITIHRFFGMASSSLEPNYLKLDEIVKLYPKVMLLVDEYSMISKALLDVMNDALIRTTQRAVATGGIKTIFFGDVAQLLPVKTSEGLIWDTLLYNHSSKFSLHKPIRQVDQVLIDVLNKVRVCKFDEDVIRFINERVVHKSDVPPNCLRLYTTRQNVNRANTKEFKRLAGDPILVPAFDIYSGSNRKSASRALKETRLLQELELKTDMPVMLIQNLQVSRGWVNGTLAKVREIDDENILLVKQAAGGAEETLWIQRISRSISGTSYVRTQFPIVPAFATTIHKAQSITIDAVAIHLDDMPSHGQLYVAMSRVRRAGDLYFFGTDLPVRIKRKFGVNLEAIDLIDYAQNNDDTMEQ